MSFVWDLPDRSWCLGIPQTLEFLLPNMRKLECFLISAQFEKPSQEKWPILDTPRFPDHLFSLVRIYIYIYISMFIPKIKLLKFPG